MVCSLIIPACIDAIKEADKVGSIKIADSMNRCPSYISDGKHGTVNQLPWEYEYESIKMLEDIYEGRMPESKFVEKSFAAVAKENIDEFWAKKRRWPFSKSQ